MMARCLIEFWRLSTWEYPEPDSGLVRETLGAPSVFKQMKRNFS